jgi:hypothetical protein
MIDLENVEFISKSHLRYENGEVVQGLQICGRGINIEKNINGCKGYKIPNGVGYIVTIFNLEGEHPVWGTNVIVTPKPMKIISQSSDKIILRGYMVEAQTPFGFMEVDLADYGLSLFLKNGVIDSCALHMFDRNVVLVYLP